MLNKIFDVKIFKGRIVIVPLRELTSNDFETVVEVEESNAVSYIMSLGDEEGQDGWVFTKEPKRYVGAYKIRFLHTIEMLDKITELELKHKTTLDIMERTYLDIIVRRYGITINHATKSYKSQADFEDKVKAENDSSLVYAQATENINKELDFRQSVYSI